MNRKLGIVTLVSLFLLVFTVTSAVASHRWGCWKYANASINWYNGGTGDYWNIYNEEARTDSNSWHNYTDLSLTPTGSGTTDHINAYNGWYGTNGWLGLAEVVASDGCTVQEGRARLNQSYLDGTYSRTNKEHVACQEIGHLFGLDHQTTTTSCMTNVVLTSPQPDEHDLEMINSIY